MPFYVCNEAFGRNKGWAEGSLEMAEYILHTKLGLAQPDWITQADYDSELARSAHDPRTQPQRLRPA